MTKLGIPIFRPFHKQDRNELFGSDMLTLGLLLDAVSYAADNDIYPKGNGKYTCYLDSFSFRQLFSDQDFKILLAGTGRTGIVADFALCLLPGTKCSLLGLDFEIVKSTTESIIPISDKNSARIRRLYIVGKDKSKKIYMEHAG
jgi:hypothetical protein